MKSLTETMNKKGQALGSLQTVVMSLVMVGLLLGVGFLVLENFRDNLTTGSEAFKGVNTTIVALTELPDWLDIVVIVSVAGIILTIVFYAIGRQQV